MMIIGLDPGLCHTGWGVIESNGGKMKAVGSGVISPKRNLPLGERLLCVMTELENILQAHQPNIAAIEDVFIGTHKNAAFTLGQAQGVLLLTCARNQIPCETYGANKIKKIISGFGHAGKEHIQKTLALFLGQSSLSNPNLRLNNEHAADALGVAITHAFFEKNTLYAKRVDGAQKNKSLVKP